MMGGSSFATKLAWYGLFAVAVAACSNSAAPPSGILLYDFCEPLAGAEVSVLDANIQATTDSDGRFVFAEPPRTGAIRTVADGFVPTLTREHDLQHGEVRAVIVPKAVSEIFHSLAGFALGPDRGTVVVTFADREQAAVAGVSVTLETAVGGQPAGVRRYVDWLEGVGLFTFTAVGQRTLPLGVAVFFDVPPGQYVLRAEHPDASIDPVRLSVRAGTVTFDTVSVPLTTGAPLPTVVGTVFFDNWPLPTAPDSVLADAKVSLYDAEGTLLEQTTTDAAGKYAMTLPRVGTRFELLYEHPNYGTDRTRRDCVQRPGALLYDQRLDNRLRPALLAQAMRDKPLAPGTGSIFVWVSKPTPSGLQDVEGATFSGVPAQAVIDYGTTGSGACSPSCERADSCDLEHPYCPAGTYCRDQYRIVNDLYEPNGSQCIVVVDRFEATQAGGWAVIANVPPGQHTIRAQTPDGPTAPRVFHVVADQWTFGWVF